jgi:hypothetical protein
MKPLNQNRMKQTAVQWLEQEIEKGIKGAYAWFELLEQAKEMEKQQIMKAVYDSMGTNIDPNIGRAELYYNQTYKNTKE